VFYGTSTQDRSICANLPGGLLAQAFEDSQLGTYKTIKLHAIQWTYACNAKQQVCLTCLKINNAYNKLHDQEWVKNASGRATPSLSIVHNYVSAFNTKKPDPTPCTVKLGVVAVFRHAQDIVWQFPVLHVTNCHDKIWWTMSDYFPVYWFWATVCASTRDNRYN